MSSPHWQPVSIRASIVMENLRALGPKISRNVGQVAKKLGSGGVEKNEVKRMIKEKHFYIR